MNLSFLMLATIGGINILYIILQGMAPGAPSLKLGFTRFFVYEPGIGFVWLIGLFLLAATLRFYLLFSKNNQQRILLNRISWTILVLLLLIEGLVIADFSGVF